MPTRHLAPLAAAVALLLVLPAFSSAAEPTPFGPPLPGFTVRQDVAVADDGSLAVARELSGGSLWLETGRSDGSGAAGREVTRPGFSLTGFDLAMAPSGEGVLAWTETDGTGSGKSTLRASVRSPGGAFGEPFTVAALENHADAPDVDVATGGAAAVSWVERANADEITGQSRVLTRPAGGSFGAPLTLSDRVFAARATAVAVTPDGAALVAFLGRDAGSEENQLISVTVAPGATPPGSPVTVSPAGESVDIFRMASTPQGRVVLVWLAFTRSENQIGFAAGTVADGVAPGRTPHRPGDARAPALAFGPGGGVVAWSEDTGAFAHIRAMHLDAEGAGSRARDVSRARARFPDVAVDAAGNATVAWQAGPRRHTRVVASTVRRGGAFSGPRTILSGRTYIYRLTLGATGNRTFVLADRFYSVRDDFMLALRAGARPIGRARLAGRLKRPTTRGGSPLPAIATTPNGTAVAVWHGQSADTEQFYVLPLAGPTP